MPFAPASAGTPRIRVALAIALGALVVAFVWHSLPTLDRNALPHPEPLTALATRSAMAPPEGADASASPGVVNANPARPAATDSRQPDHVDIDPAKAFRASPSQRADDARRLRDATDLAGFAAELSDRARQGDADAAQALADLMNHCGMSYAAPPDAEMWRQLRFYGQYDEAQLQTAAQAMLAQQSRCTSAFAQSKPEWYDAQGRRSNRLAAELGNPAASVERPFEDLRTPEARLAHAVELRAALARVLDESDAEALARHALPLAAYSGLRSEAFAIAACTLNPVCAADPQDYPLYLMHSGQLGNNLGAYFSLLTLTPRERQIAQVQAEHILRLWRTRRFAELVAAQTPIAPGGP